MGTLPNSSKLKEGACKAEKVDGQEEGLGRTGLGQMTRTRKEERVPVAE